jgi:hypothetical protein
MGWELRVLDGKIGNCLSYSKDFPDIGKVIIQLNRYPADLRFSGEPKAEVVISVSGQETAISKFAEDTYAFFFVQDKCNEFEVASRHAEVVNK